MRFAVIFFFLTTVQIFGTVYSHSTRLSLELRNASVVEVFQAIETTSEYKFLYHDALISPEQKYNISIKDQTLEEILNNLFADSENTYSILENNLVVITPKTNNAQQQNVITGTITDKDGNPLPGVNIVEKGTSNGSITNNDGNYTISVSSSAAELVFSFVGYLTEEVQVGSQTKIDFSLIENIEELEDVIVVGYGSMERTNVTGAISTIKTDELNKAPVPNLIEAMRGQVAGVRMARTSGLPGSGVEFFIRGKNSLNNSNEPLIVIDGVPSTGGNLAEINPNDIESVNILKDAAAASIYGVHGANGVILVTTKDGQSGKPTLNVNFSRGYTDMVNKPRLMNAEEFVQLKIDAAVGGNRPSTVEDVLNDAVEYANYTDSTGIKEIDWHDELLRIGKITNAGVSLSGGTDKVTFYMSGNAYLEDGIVQHTSFDRYSFRLNADYKPFKFLNLGARVQLSKTLADETGNAAVWYQGAADFTDFIGNTPLGRIRNENNELVPTVKSDQFDYNPFFKYQESKTDRTNSRYLINPYIEFNLVKGLTYRINASIEQRAEKFGRFTSSRYRWSTLNDEPGNNTMENTMALPVSYLLDNILTFDKEFGKHKLNITLVYGFQTWTSDSLKTSGEGSPTDLLSYNSIDGTLSDFRDITMATDEWANVYYVGRFRYSYDRRYNFTGTLRRDGSTVFGENYRWGVFPSVSFAWNINNESFMDNVPIETLKYRISWGKMGNDQIGTYGYIANTRNRAYSFSGNNVSGLTPSNLPNPDLHWETSQQFNTGLDFGLLNNRLFGSIDVYKNKTVELILDKLIPSVTGYTKIISNIGETENKGVEVDLDYRILDGDFKWNVNVNWAKDQNKIIRLNDTRDADGNPIDDEANGWFIGQDIDVLYEYDFIGIYQYGEEEEASRLHWTIPSYGPGYPKIRDIDGNDTINFEDQTFLGSPTPDWYGGIRNTFSYKGFELTVLIEAVQGVTKINKFYGLLTSRGNEIKVDYWTPENPSNEFPEPNVMGPYYFSDAVRVRDASFIALRNVSLSYNLPQKLLQKIKVSNLQVYIRGNNLKYWTAYKDAYSPETVLGAYPITKVWTFGTNITF